MAVDSSTLKLLAETRAVDLWYLFPLDAVSRQITGNLDCVDEHKQRRIDEIFGNQNWREDIYSIETTQDLFAEMITTAIKNSTAARSNDTQKFV